MTQADFINKLNSVNPLEIVSIPEVKAKYISNYNSFWNEGGEATYQREARYFNDLLKTIIENNQNTCAKRGMQMKPMDRFSIFNAFIESSITNISLEPGIRALAYLTLRGINANGQWIDTIKFTVSGYGEMVARIRCGQIRHVDNPIVVYKGDTFKIKDDGDGKKVIYELDIDHDPSEIKACFMRITRADGSYDYAYMLKEDWKRLEDYSLKQNQRKDKDGRVYGSANALYKTEQGQIDPGFLQAKLIKHAFKTYPKVKIGAMTIMADEDDEAQNIIQNQFSEESSEDVFAEDVFQVKDESKQQVINDNDDIFS